MNKQESVRSNETIFLDPENRSFEKSVFLNRNYLRKYLTYLHFFVGPQVVAGRALLNIVEPVLEITSIKRPPLHSYHSQVSLSNIW